MPFAEILGHDHVKDVLTRLLARERLPGAVLLAGPSGVGKRRLAMEVARALVCEGGTAEAPPSEACGRCNSCLRSARDIHPDVTLIEPATKTAIKIEQVREAVPKILSRPFEGRARAFVIDDAHLLTEEAGNALLKSLEEPPPTSHVLLVSASPQTLLPTIRSRCQTIRVGALPAAVIERYLRSQGGLTPEDAALRAALAGGSLGQALAFESDAYRDAREGVAKLLEAAPGADPMVRLELAQWLEEQDDLAMALLAMRSLLRDVAAVASGGGEGVRLLNADLAPRIAAMARGRLGVRAVLAWEGAADAQEALRGNANKALTMDVLLDTVAG